jgi:hypothetical protein
LTIYDNYFQQYNQLFINNNNQNKTQNKVIKNNKRLNANKNKSMNGLKVFKFNFNNKCIYETKSKSNLNPHLNTVRKNIKKFVCVWPQCRQSFDF